MQNCENFFQIYVDGSCDNAKTRIGGWSFVVLNKDKEIIEKKCGFFLDTTSNRMEMQAMIEGLSNIPKWSEVEIVSDSQYAIGVFGGTTKASVNLDLLWKFKIIVSIKNLQVKFVWVRGHSGDIMNEYCDRCATGIQKKAIENYKFLQKTDSSLH